MKGNFNNVISSGKNTIRRFMPEKTSYRWRTLACSPPSLSSSDWILAAQCLHLHSTLLHSTTSVLYLLYCNRLGRVKINSISEWLYSSESLMETKQPEDSASWSRLKTSVTSGALATLNASHFSYTPHGVTWKQCFKSKTAIKTYIIAEVFWTVWIKGLHWFTGPANYPSPLRWAVWELRTDCHIFASWLFKTVI